MNRSLQDVILEYPQAPHLVCHLMPGQRWNNLTGNAVEALIEGRNPPLPIQEFLEHLEKNYPDAFAQIQHVYAYCYKATAREYAIQKVPIEGFEVRLAVIHMGFYPQYRKLLFDERLKITKETGWYPYIVGAKIAFDTSTYSNVSDIHPERLLIGELVGIRRVAKPLKTTSNLNAFLLEGTQGNILLDTGFEVDLAQARDLKAIFISHMHGDHTGGLDQFIGKTSVPVILSDATARYLAQTRFSESNQLQAFQSQVVVVDQSPKDLTNSQLDTYPIFHTPGALGLTYTDNRGKAVFFPGDICLRNGFYADQYRQLLKRILKHPAREKYVFMDMAMARGRAETVIDEEDIPNSVIEEFAFTNKRDVFFLGHVQELSIYTYLYAWQMTQKFPSENRPMFVLNDNYYNLLGSLYTYMTAGKLYHKDPLVKYLWDGHTSNFAESYRVYPLSALPNFLPEDKFIFFTSDQDLKTNPALQSRLKWSNVIRLAKLATEQDVELAQLCEPCRNILKVASPDWSFHSRECDTIEFIRELNQAGVKVILFHLGTESLRAIIKRHALDARMVIACSGDRITF